MAQLDKIRLSGVTYDIIDATAIHSLDGYYTTGETNAAITAATNALAESIAEQGYQTSGDVQNAISGKADADDVYTKQETSDLIDEKIAEASGTTTGEVQTMIDQAVSGKVDTTTYTAYTAATDSTLSNKADKSEIPSVTGYADSVTYNDTSKYVEFYHGGTGGTKVYEFDASPFLIDGMVESVVITSITSGGSEVIVLEITWNSAAGGQVTDIPLTDIFDASNYYTKNDVNGLLANKADTTAMTQAISEATSGKADTTAVTQAISEAVSGKADTTAMTQAITEATSGKADTSTVESINNTLTAHTANTDIHVTTADKTAWSGKQDALVSGTNIKTINGASILGAGDLTTLQVEVSGTTLVFS